MNSSNSQLLYFEKRKLPVLAMAFLAILLPFDFFLSPAILFIAIAVFFTQPLKQSFANLKSRPIFLLFSACYLLYVLGLINTENQEIGMRELEYKLSIIIFPIIIAACNKLEKKDLQLIAKSFIASIFLVAILSMLISSYRIDFQYLPSYIELSVFIHPTYLSTYLNLAFVFILKLLGLSNFKRSNRILFYLLLAFLVTFNLLLNSKIGILVNFLLIFYFIVESFSRYSKKVSILFLLAFIGGMFFVLTQVPSIKGRFHNLDQILDVDKIPKDADESTALRVLVWHQVAQIFQEHPWVGVGTGDTKAELMKKYETNGIEYAFKNRLNTHNQYLEWLITFGVLGLLFWLISIVFPLIFAFKSGNVLYLLFLFSVLLVFFVESFLEREVGIIYFAFFNSLLFFHGPNLEKERKQ